MINEFQIQSNYSLFSLSVDQYFMWYYIAPAVGALALFLLLLCICCLRRRNRNKPLTPISLNGTKTVRSLASPALSNNSSRRNRGLNNLEMNALLPQRQTTNRVTEYPKSSIRCVQELGEGAFGKVYRGELLINGGAIVPIAIKTLKEGASLKTQQDFRREAELMTDLQHPNIVCLLGVCIREEPMSMLFEYMSKGDLHEYLISHSPRSDVISDDNQRILEIPDFLHIATQVAAGMEYLSGHHFVHRDLAARNCLVGEHLTVKISDFGLSRDIYSSDYYRVQSKSLLPVRYVRQTSQSFLILCFKNHLNLCQNIICLSVMPFLLCHQMDAPRELSLREVHNRERRLVFWSRFVGNIQLWSPTLLWLHKH